MARACFWSVKRLSKGKMAGSSRGPKIGQTAEYRRDQSGMVLMGSRRVGVGLDNGSVYVSVPTAVSSHAPGSGVAFWGVTSNVGVGRQAREAAVQACDAQHVGDADGGEYLRGGAYRAQACRLEYRISPGTKGGIGPTELTLLP